MSDKKEITAGSSALCSFGHCSMKGYRSTMEDRHSSMLDVVFKEQEKKPGCFFGVYDGHGGDSVAEFISKTLPQTILQAGLTDKEISDAFVKVDSNITENDTGSTCVIALVTQESETTVKIVCANSGDSRCILFQDDKITALSQDQKPTNDEERKRILESGNIVLIGRVNGSLAVSRAFGDHRYKRSRDKQDQPLSPDKQAVTVVPEISTTFVDLAAAKHTALVLACDGVWDVLKNPDICKQIVAKFEEQEAKEGFDGKFDLGLIAESVVTKCIKELGSSDNCTLIIVVLHNPAAKQQQKQQQTNSSSTTTTTTAVHSNSSNSTVDGQQQQNSNEGGGTSNTTAQQQ
jgi:protein phosphatase 2C family protein 2/3